MHCTSLLFCCYLLYACPYHESFVTYTNGSCEDCIRDIAITTEAIIGLDNPGYLSQMYICHNNNNIIIMYLLSVKEIGVTYTLHTLHIQMVK